MLAVILLMLIFVKFFMFICSILGWLNEGIIALKGIYIAIVNIPSKASESALKGLL